MTTSSSGKALKASRRRRSPSQHHQGPLVDAGAPALAIPQYLTPEEAAVLLAVSPRALRSRCRREARRVGDDVIARLGDGLVAIKFGRSWRVRREALE
jgi:hypothetical protein